MRERRHVVHGSHHLHVAHTSQRDRALAILRRLLRVRGIENVSVRERSHRLRDVAEQPHDLLQRRRLIELAGDEQHGVVGLIVLVIERLQPLDRHVLDVRARADGRVPVVVPEIGGGDRALQQNAERIVLAGLELVAHHGHLRSSDPSRRSGCASCGPPRARAPSRDSRRSTSSSRSSSCGRATWTRSSERRACPSRRVCRDASVVPLNCMCSSRCAIPVSPYPSCRDPTMYVTFTVTVGFDWSGKRSTRSPFGRRYSVIPSTEVTLVARCCACAPTVIPSASARATNDDISH